MPSQMDIFFLDVKEVPYAKSRRRQKESVQDVLKPLKCIWYGSVSKRVHVWVEGNRLPDFDCLVDMSSAFFSWKRTKDKRGPNLYSLTDSVGRTVTPMSCWAMIRRKLGAGIERVPSIVYQPTLRLRGPGSNFRGAFDLTPAFPLGNRTYLIPFSRSQWMKTEALKQKDKLKRYDTYRDFKNILRTLKRFVQKEKLDVPSYYITSFMFDLAKKTKKKRWNGNGRKRAARLWWVFKRFHETLDTGVPDAEDPTTIRRLKEARVVKEVAAKYLEAGAYNNTVDTLRRLFIG